jgi:hypothetical protein
MQPAAGRMSLSIQVNANIVDLYHEIDVRVSNDPPGAGAVNVFGCRRLFSAWADASTNSIALGSVT